MFAFTPKTLFTASLQDGTTNSWTQDTRTRISQLAIPYDQGTKEKIREKFKKVELSVSSYDTAWVAKVPSPNAQHQPCFPKCLDWLLKNQLPDGSWSLPFRGEFLVKDSILSTLASVLALKKWEVSEEQVRRGMSYIESNFGAIHDRKQLVPVGFNVIFPSMLENSKDLGLDFNLNKKCVDEVFRKRDLEYKRMSKCKSRVGKGYIASICEGLNESYDWKEIKKYQRSNGSVANSPSATASFLMHSPDANALEYLRSLLDSFGSAVPTIYPMDVYIRLCMVDRLERLGINRHFDIEIKDVLDETYRCWLRRDEEIFLDIETCALAFRLLRTNGYEVSSDALDEFAKEDYPFNRKTQNLKEVYSMLELYKASEIMTSPDELVLEKIRSWTSRFLVMDLSKSTAAKDDKFYREVNHALNFNYNTIVQRLENRRNIELYRGDEIRMLKTSYRCLNIDNNEFLKFAADDYNFCQAIHQKELKDLEGWEELNGLDKLKFARLRATFAYFMIAAILPTPERADARMVFTKYISLITVIDDFFDFEGCTEELKNLIELVQKWECDSLYYSEPVETIYRAVYRTTNELSDIAFPVQRRSIRSHLVDLWVDLLNAMLSEHEQARAKLAPTIEDYLDYAHVAIGFKLSALSVLYVLGVQISEEIIASPEYNILAKNVAMCCRLRNDIQGFQREAKEGKLNSVLLCMIHREGFVASEHEAVKKVESIISRTNGETLGVVFKTKGSVLDRACKDLLWNVNRISEFIYKDHDCFSFPQKMAADVNAVLYEPINVSSSDLETIE